MERMEYGKVSKIGAEFELRLIADKIAKLKTQNRETFELLCSKQRPENSAPLDRKMTINKKKIHELREMQRAYETIIELYEQIKGGAK